MTKKENTGLDFLIDKLTNSIENVITGDSFATDISLLSLKDLKLVIKNKAGFLIGKKNLKNLQEMFSN